MLNQFFELMKKYEEEYNLDSSIILAGRTKEDTTIVNIKYKLGEFVNTIPFEFKNTQSVDWKDVKETLNEQAKELLRTYTRSIVKEN